MVSFVFIIIFGVSHNRYFPMNVHYEIQQGTVGASRPEGRLPGIPFLTLVSPIPCQINLTHKQANRLQNLESTY